MLMLPSKGVSVHKMRRTQIQLLWCVLLLLACLSQGSAETKQFRTPARVLAKQTGATQFEEERYETHTNCNEHKHHLKKRASDEDVDYEVYQGVVGRPGIDFPIYPRIPKTTFSCRSYGNGYFADMETDCQVFHICEEGRKISFLCPNGTIFQQSELTCDWWFKVNCLGSSGYYAESAEILNKQRVHRVRPSVPVQGFNIVGGGLNIKPKVTPVVGQARAGGRGSSKSDRRIDSTEELHASLESVDFDDVSGEKQRKVLPSIDNNSNDHESQITAESSSFVSGTGKRRSDSNNNNNGKSNGNSNNNGNSNSSPNSSDDSTILKPTRSRSSSSSSSSGSSQEFRERARNGQRGQQRYKDLESEEQHSKEKNKEKAKEKPDFFEAYSVRPVQHTTPHYTPSSHSTVRRLEPSKSTPFYTPTVPSVPKSKVSEGKLNYIKGGHAATTPNPNRFGSAAISGLFLEAKPTASASLELDSTYRPIVIGMRHHYDVASSGELKQTPKKSESRDYLPTTPAPTSTSSGPTYLPKVGASVPRTNAAAAAAGEESLLFAPNPVKEESVYRNVQDMLKTVNLLKDKFEDVELNAQPATNGRAGLEIPPSSGPDALVSLAKYFAQEHNESGNSLVKPEKSGGQTKLSAKAPASILPTVKPSDTTATLTTSEPPPSISEQADDIKQSLLSAKTVQKYSNLFGLKDVKGRGSLEGQVDISAGLLSNETQSPAKSADYQPFPQIGSTGSTIAKLAEQPESRKIAQIFSNALTSYLDNPGSFRAELAARARPTEPPNFKPVTTTDASLFSDGTAKYYLPTKPSPDVTTPQNIALEINHKFDSTPAPEYSTTTELYELSTSRGQDSELELSAELSPPSPDSGEGDEFLQQQQTQSFVKSRNDLLKDARPQKLITTLKPTEHPWALKSQTDFLDPLTINDALMKERTTTTTSSTSAPFTYSPRSLGSSTATPSPVHYEWEDIFRSYDIPRDALPSSSGLQRIANKLFGGLNEQEALHLRNVMAKAEHDRQVLSLLLLLIQTCDDHNGKALERSRKHLLNALIDIDSKISSKHVSRQQQQQQQLATTTTRVPVTTFRRGSNADYYTSTTPGYTTSTELPPFSTSTTAPGSYEETTKFEIRVEDVDDLDLAATTPTPTPAQPEIHSDRRALELLKSLYSLASKFSSRR
ncbi:PREDICTED: probable serine/threonine-protein kinase nek3 [Drosophila arizonae]|uniref:Probable serine/threonine-protein kinase nek3 n=1 Tax=Drosophila arizonae TaxID=7263 RepID=A0ABM1NM95_DROAR|nr:PREDICTED: probable serine/threonine-protein kinase nek3 [Drosophila arizonae]XP_017856081.1 PREDICTED: probable serine/threonine-protein kinase nek3 [Drosophila arizonae]